MTDQKKIHILAAEYMTDLTSKVHQRLEDNGFLYAALEYVNFASKEVKPRIPVTVRMEHTYLFQSLYHPTPNDAMIKLLLTNDALSRSSAEKITLVLPYMSYLRQDRKDESRVPISARVMADIIQTNPKVEKVITLDMHSDQEQGFYRISLDNLPGAWVLADYFEKKYGPDLSDLVVVSPDYGGTKRARDFARYLDGRDEIGVMEKRRSGDRAQKVETLGYQGPSVVGKNVVLYDDMIDTGGSIISATKALQSFGAKKVYAVASHGLFSPPNADLTAEERLRKAGMQVVVTNSIPRSEEYQREHGDWLTMLPLDEMLAKAVLETSKPGGSVSSLFAGRK
ncbi:MAG TPA: ribose-phosphate pyrophosphokinase [Candidatus Nanoarchaeia archaeon]|nr:ribose-phosphate pyrophosphokinase [Candidatus Nanoarchaeia archaeon]